MDLDSYTSSYSSINMNKIYDLRGHNVIQTPNMSDYLFISQFRHILQIQCIQVSNMEKIGTICCECKYYKYKLFVNMD